MDTAAPQPAPLDEPDLTGIGPVGGPVSVAWREGTLTRAKELQALCAWVLANDPQGNSAALATAVRHHLDAAREAAEAAKLFRNGPLLERAMSNLDAAEAEILNFAPPDYVLGLVPSLLWHVQCHLIATDPRRQEFERIAQKLGVKDTDHPLLETTDQALDDKRRTVCEERGKIVTAVRGASSAKLREQLRVRSFRNVVVITTLLMTLLAIGLALTGFFRPKLIPMCFAPQNGDQVVIVCPTGQTKVPHPKSPASIDRTIDRTASRQDLLVIELIGLTAAAIAAAAAIRGIRGSSERYGMPVALIALKLPTGALTAFLGLLLMRGQFVPGLSALDTSAQILAWALVFGYAQELFTRLVDRQGQTVLDSVRGADKAPPSPTPP